MTPLLRVPAHARRASLGDRFELPGWQQLLLLGRRIALNAFIALQPVAGPTETGGVLLEDALAFDSDLSLAATAGFLFGVIDGDAIVRLGHGHRSGRAGLRLLGGRDPLAFPLHQ